MWNSLPKTLVRVGCADADGQTTRGGALGETLNAYRCHHEGPLMGRVKPHAGGGSGPIYL
jgi:hypothetical protein